MSNAEVLERLANEREEKIQQTISKIYSQNAHEHPLWEVVTELKREHAALLAGIAAIKQAEALETLEQELRKHAEAERKEGENFVEILEFGLGEVDKIKAVYGVCDLQYRLLRKLSRGGLSVKEISVQLGKSSSWVSRSADLLLEVGFIESVPVPEDKRVCLLQLTAKGDKLLEEVGESYKDFLSKITV